MAMPLRVYFDLASPYAYAAFDETIRIAEAAGLDLRLSPVLVWAILKVQGIVPPLEVAARHDYLMRDMARSAAFHGLPYAPPLPLPISAHRASRMWLGLSGEVSPHGITLARCLFAARFVEGRDIRKTDVLVSVACACGFTEADALAAIDGHASRDALEASITRAIADGATGVPFFLLDGEPFFGADRLPQIRWRLGFPTSAG